MNVALIVVGQICVLFVFIITGFILRKKDIIPVQSGAVLSKLVVWIFLPAICIRTLSSYVTIERLGANAELLLFGIAAAVVVFILAHIFGKILSVNDAGRRILTYSFVVPNLSYVGYPIVEEVLGEEMLSNFIVFTLPISILMYTWGVYILTKQEKITLKSFKNPVIIATGAGIILGLCSVPIPGLITKILTTAGNCMAPCAMLLAGIVLAKGSLRAAFTNWRTYIATAVRLMLLPLLIGLMAKLCRVSETVRIISIIAMAMPMGLNSIVFPEAAGMDSTEGANTCIVSHVFCIITVPIIVMMITGA